MISFWDEYAPKYKYHKDVAKADDPFMLDELRKLEQSFTQQKLEKLEQQRVYATSFRMQLFQDVIKQAPLLHQTNQSITTIKNLFTTFANPKLQAQWFYDSSFPIATFQKAVSQLQAYQTRFTYDSYVSSLQTKNAKELEADLVIIYQLYVLAMKPFLVKHESFDHKLFSLYPKFINYSQKEWDVLLTQQRYKTLANPHANQNEAFKVKYDQFFAYLVKLEEAKQTNKFFLSFLANVLAQ